MHGITAMKLLKQHEKSKKIPVIALSANSKQDFVDNILFEGFQDYILKPIDINKFLGVLDQYISQKMN